VKVKAVCVRWFRGSSFWMELIGLWVDRLKRGFVVDKLKKGVAVDRQRGVKKS
jgi:hypothetical protein